MPQNYPFILPGCHHTLEVNAGYFAERGIQVGDCVSVPALADFAALGNALFHALAVAFWRKPMKRPDADARGVLQ